MNKTYFLPIVFFMLALSACGSNQKAAQSPEENSGSNQADNVNIPQPSIPQPSIPQVNIPQANIPQANIPNITFPEVNFPQVNFPEINFPNIKIQQGENTTIYTLPADILFDFDKANLRPDAEAALQQISSSIAQRFPNAPIQINGHTDSVGGDAYNLQLSEQRAESVRQWLIKNKNMQPDRMTTKGLGETQPVAPNTNPDGSDNPQGRQQNRRVEIVVRSSSS